MGNRRGGGETVVDLIKEDRKIEGRGKGRKKERYA